MVHNGSSYKEKTVKVIIDDPKAVNALAGLSANLLQYPDGYVYNLSLIHISSSRTQQACSFFMAITYMGAVLNHSL